MRWTALGLTMAGMLLVAGTAAAEGGSGGKGDEGNKGGTGPATDTQEPQTSSDSTNDNSLVQYRKSAIGASGQNPDESLTKQEQRPWWISATWETHRLIRQEDVNSERASNSLYFAAGYNITDRDLVTLSWGISQSLIADPGETGFRGSDIIGTYTRLVPLPEKFNLNLRASASAPVSYYSQLQSNITTLGLGVGLSRRFGDLFISLNGSGSVSIDKYAEAGGINDQFGEAPNPHYHIGISAIAEYSMPFHRPLSLGLSAIDSYSWAYNVQNGSCVGSAEVLCQQGQGGVVSDAVYTSQPMQQSYGGEIFARYVLPTVLGFNSTATLALADGDGGVGLNQLLHDGVVHPYLFYRDTAEVYASLDFRY